MLSANPSSPPSWRPSRRIALLAALVLALLLGSQAGCADELLPRAPQSQLDAARRAGRWIAEPFAYWPQLGPGVETRAQTSFDRTGSNADGFEGTHATLYLRRVAGRDEHVIVDSAGPGVLRTLWFTGPDEGGEGLELGTLRFYIDDVDAGSEPKLTLTQRELFCGAGPAPFRPPLVSHNRQSSGAFVSWVPLPFARRLIVTTDKQPRFVAAHLERLPTGAPLPAKVGSSGWRRSAARLARRLQRRRLGDAPRRWQTVPLRHRYRGAGTLVGLRFTPAAPVRAGQLAAARIQIRWDGAAQPAIDAPLDLFFGSGLGEGTVNALAFSMRPGGPYENRFPMPFWRGFALELSGLAGKLELALAPPRFSRRNAGHLHTRAFAQPSPRAGQDVLMAELHGEGKLVGTVLSVRPEPHVKRWWEGDLRSYVDGRRTPGIHGTGIEDDHLAGWSNTLFRNPFSLPLHGEPVSRLIEEQGLQHNAEISLYRLWPGIHFDQQLRHGFEHGNENTVSARYRGLSFFYRRPSKLGSAPPLQQVDLLRLADADSRRVHEVAIEGSADMLTLTSAFEGEDYQRAFEATTYTHRGAIRFRVWLSNPALGANRGCWLRRLYDQSRGRQRAKVFVNERYLRDWYVAEGNTSRAWAERGVFLPASITAGRSSLTIRLEPQSKAEGPPWNAAEYRLLCLQPR
jgi:hypothetical protein